ncbi:MAG TPA: alpha/beta fold hydrolase [Ilumatobacteraceae bacterium]|nr:alpha/beta fold hydrolase [Ilumatobacteraceae bacterium]
MHARETFVESRGARLYVRDVGDGLPIVVVHGGPDFDHEYLLPDLDCLTDAYRLVYYDQRGRGRSSEGIGPDDVTMRTEMEDLDAVRQSLGVDSIILLGHSWGGLLAMEYAIRSPRRVSHLVLMNTAPASCAGAALLRQELARRRSPAESEAMASIVASDRFRAGDLAVDAEYYRIHFRSAFKQPGLLEQLLGRLRANFTEAGVVLARQIEDHLYAETWRRDEYDLTPQLARLPTPTLVIRGADDFVPGAIAGNIAQAIPRSRLVVLEDCGHFAFIERPEQVRVCLAEFLSP